MPDKKKSWMKEWRQKAAEKGTLENMAHVAFEVDVLRDPSDAMTKWEIPDSVQEIVYRRMYEDIVSLAGLDDKEAAQSISEDTRTPEQEAALNAAMARMTEQRLKSFYGSNYGVAADTLNDFADESKPDSEDDFTTKDQVLLYFFATHLDILPKNRGGMTAARKAELIDLYKRFSDFLTTLPADFTGIAIEAFAQQDRPHNVRETLDHIKMIQADSVDYPLDKVNHSIWRVFSGATGTQLIKAEKAGSKKQISILYSIDFDALSDVKITRRLTSYDKRVYIAVSALFNAGNDIITLAQIYSTMGYKGRPGKSDIARINEALSKMNGARITVDNTQEAAAYKYDKFVYKGSLLPFEQVEVVARGQVVDTAVHLFREPPVMTFARQRQQLTTINLKLLQSPISKTEDNLLIEDYLIERISRAREGKQQRKIMFATMFEKVNAADKQTRRRAREKADRYLTYYQECGLIASFTVDKDCITFSFAPQAIEAGKAHDTQEAQESRAE